MESTLFGLVMPYFWRKCQHFCYQEWTFKAKIENREEKYCSLEQSRKLHRCYQPILLLDLPKWAKKVFFLIKLLLKIDLTVYQKNFSLFEAIYGHRKQISHSFWQNNFLIIMLQNNNFLLSVRGHSANIFRVQMKLTGRKYFLY